ncbi:MAG: hypothetical protein LBO73_01110 [Holosporaceae bacterium]|nr:hypothetical protein [Holosporaceae bacterium]
MKFLEFVENSPADLKKVLVETVCRSQGPTSLLGTIGFWTTASYWTYLVSRDLIKHTGLFNPRNEENFVQNSKDGYLIPVSAFY